MNKPMTFSIAVDLTHTSPSARASILALAQFQASTILTSLDYGSDWIFNPSTVISICSNYDGIGAASCSIENLKVLYRNPTDFLEMPFSNHGLSLSISICLNNFSSNTWRLYIKRRNWNDSCKCSRKSAWFCHSICHSSHLELSMISFIFF